MRRASLTLALCLLLLPVVGLADTIDFSTSGLGIGGTITVQGGTITGVGIKIGGVEGMSTPSNAGPVFPVTGGTLNFTGSAMAFQMLGGYGYYSFSLGTLSITGGVSAAGVANNTTLMNYVPPTGSVIVLATTPTGIWNVMPGGPDTKDSNLLTFFGEPSGGDWEFGGNVSTFAGPSCAIHNTCGSSGFRLTAAGSTDIQDTPITPEPLITPEPVTSSLLGLGVFALLGLGRRRR
jgi:MYXO-CTERM domain-containing protein